jgi:hypothetical protein
LDENVSLAVLEKAASPSSNRFPILTEALIRRPMRAMLGSKRVPFRKFQYFAENAHPLDIAAAEANVFPAFDDGVVRSWRRSSSSRDRAWLKSKIRMALEEYGVEPNRGNIRLLESLTGAGRVG